VAVKWSNEYTKQIRQHTTTNVEFMDVLTVNTPKKLPRVEFLLDSSIEYFGLLHISWKVLDHQLDVCGITPLNPLRRPNYRAN
jgi:hypothetical protein